MKYLIIEILFGWLTTPILHLNLMQLFTALTEWIVISWIIKLICKVGRKGKKWREKYGR